MTTRLVPRLVATTAMLLTALAGIAPARAATITVGSFAQFGGGCTLGNAILTAKGQTPIGDCVPQGAFGADVIVLPAGTYTVQQQDGGNAYPTIDRAITIVGNGSTIVRPIGIGQNFRFFRVTAGHLKLLDLTLSGGRVTNANGGAILVSGGASLTLARVTLNNHTVDSPPAGAKGGAVAMGGGGVLTAIGSAFIDNSAVSGGSGLAHGGAINVDTSVPVVVNLVSSTFQGNTAAANGASGGLSQGGALSFEGAGAITITNCTFLQNAALSNGTSVSGIATETIVAVGDGGAARGGAIYVQSENPATSVEIGGTVLRQNTASATGIGNADPSTGALGGAVYVDLAGAGLTVRDSRFWENHASASSQARGGGARGGGLYAVLGAAGTATIVRSALIQNTLSVDSGVPVGSPPVAVASGAGIRIEGTASLSISASTIALNAISANSAVAGGTQGQGAGISFASTGLLTLLSDTLAGNAITAANGSAQGGGLATSGPATIQNTIFSGNAAETSPNCFGASPSSLGNNLFADGGACGSNGSDIVGVPAGLGPLTDSSAPAGLVLPLLAGPAIAAANSAACPVVDQLGHGREGLCDIGAVELVPSVPLTTLVAAVLPSSRAGLAGTTITAFVSVINASSVPAYQVAIAQSSATPTLLTYQTTDPATNVPTGRPNTPIDIPPGGVQTFVIALLITGPFTPTDIALTYAGTNTLPVAALPGINTLLASGSVTPIADVVALAATSSNDGTVQMVRPPSVAVWSGAFAVATVNLGAAGQITVAPSATGAAQAILAVCETVPATGACKSAPEPTPSVFIGSGATPTFAVFVQSPSEIPFDPSTNRIFLSFKDGGGATRGGTSVAVYTQP